MDDLDGEIHRLVDAQERHIDDDCTNLYAGTNAPSPRLARLLGSSIGSRPNLGAPGDTYNRGMDDGSRLSVLCDALVGSLFAQVLRGDVESETLRAAVGEFRRSFTGVHFVSPDRTS